MENKGAYKALEQVALKMGITVSEVIFEIDEAILAAYSKAKESNNVELLRKWQKIPRKGEIPTAVEFVDYMSKRLTEEKESTTNPDYFVLS